jgi:hypothetical protein
MLIPRKIAICFKALSLNAPWNCVTIRAQKPRSDPTSRDVSDLFIGSPQIYEGKPNNGFAKELIEKNLRATVFVMVFREIFRARQPAERISKNGAADPPLHQPEINKLNKL